MQFNFLLTFLLLFFLSLRSILHVRLATLYVLCVRCTLQPYVKMRFRRQSSLFRFPFHFWKTKTETEFIVRLSIFFFFAFIWLNLTLSNWQQRRDEILKVIQSIEYDEHHNVPHRMTNLMSNLTKQNLWALYVFIAHIDRNCIYWRCWNRMRQCSECVLYSIELQAEHTFQQICSVI